MANSYELVLLLSPSESPEDMNHAVTALRVIGAERAATVACSTAADAVSTLETAAENYRIVSTITYDWDPKRTDTSIFDYRLMHNEDLQSIAGMIQAEFVPLEVNYSEPEADYPARLQTLIFDTPRTGCLFVISPADTIRVAFSLLGLPREGQDILPVFSMWQVYPSSRKAINTYSVESFDDLGEYMKTRVIPQVKLDEIPMTTSEIYSGGGQESLVASHCPPIQPMEISVAAEVHSESVPPSDAPAQSSDVPAFVPEESSEPVEAPLPSSVFPPVSQEPPQPQFPEQPATQPAFQPPPIVETELSVEPEVPQDTSSPPPAPTNFPPPPEKPAPVNFVPPPEKPVPVKLVPPPVKLLVPELSPTEKHLQAELQSTCTTLNTDLAAILNKKLFPGREYDPMERIVQFVSEMLVTLERQHEAAIESLREEVSSLDLLSSSENISTLLNELSSVSTAQQEVEHRVREVAASVVPAVAEMKDKVYELMQRAEQTKKAIKDMNEEKLNAAMPLAIRQVVRKEDGNFYATITSRKRYQIWGYISIYEGSELISETTGALSFVRQQEMNLNTIAELKPGHRYEVAVNHYLDKSRISNLKDFGE